MMEYIKENKKTISNILLLSTLINIFFFPTSYDGNLPNVYFTMFQWTMLCGHLFIALLLMSVDKTSFKIIVFLLIYLIGVTIFVSFDPHFTFSVARFMPVIASLFLLIIEPSDLGYEKQTILKVLNIILLIIFVVNVLTLLNITFAREFMYRFYTQFYKGAMQGAFHRNKPVFTFGVHNIASFFYMILFLYIYYYFMKVKKEKILIVHMILLTGYSFLLSSSLSLGYAGLMSILLMTAILTFIEKRSYKFVFVAVISLIAINVIPYERFIGLLLKQSNGFIPRYFSENSIFSVNYMVIGKYPTGIGFTIADATIPLYYADSGIIILLTMGSLPLLSASYYLLYRLFSKVFGSWMLLLYLLVVLMLETSMPSLIYYKAIYVHLLTILIFSSIYRTNNLEVQ